MVFDCGYIIAGSVGALLALAVHAIQYKERGRKCDQSESRPANPGRLDCRDRAEGSERD